MKPFFIALLVVLVTGCVNTSNLYSNYHKEVQAAVPKAWLSNFIEGSIDNNWLQQLDNAQLTKIVEAGIKNNLSLEKTAASVATAYAQANVTAGGNLPTFNLNFRSNRTRRNSAASSTGEVIYANLFDLSLNMSWNIDFWGSLSSGEKAAMYRYQAAFTQYQQSLQTTVAAIARSWFSLKTEQWLAELDQQKVVLAETLLQQIQSSYSLGLETAYNLHSQQAKIINYQNQFLRRELNVRQERRKLEQLIGSYPAATIVLDNTKPVLGDRIPAGLPSELLQRRPDLLTAQTQLKASYETIAQARGNRFPSLMLTASAGRSSDQLKSLTNNNLSVFGITGALTLPLFSFGTLEAKEKLAEAQAKEQEIAYQQLLHQAFFDVEQALDTDASLVEQIKLAEQTSEAYQKATNTAANEYRSGTGTLSNWTNAEISAHDAKSSLLTLQRQQMHNRINLHLALGGKFSQTIEHQVPTDQADTNSKDQS